MSAPSSPTPSPSPRDAAGLRSLWNKISAVASGTKDSAIDSAIDTGSAIASTAKGVALGSAQTAGGLAQQTGSFVKITAGGLRDRAGNIADSLAQAAGSVTEVADSVTEVAGSMTEVAGNAAGAIVGKTTAGLGTVGNTTASLAAQTTQQLGQAVHFFNDNPLLKQATGIVPANWMLGLVNQVDIEKAAAAVKQLRAAHPHESPRQLAHRIMVQKTVYAGGLGLASSLVPGAAAALFAVDLTATVLIQAEMVYQIAMIYGIDPADPARKGEVLAIFGLSMGGQKAMEAGTQYLARAGLSAVFENIPVAGAVIGASSNAVLNYAIGHAACRFYESQIDASQPTPLESEEALEAAAAEGERFLEESEAQQRIMDQILAHSVLTAYPEEQWEDLVPELEGLKLPPDSLAAIAQHLQQPDPLDDLLAALSPDFAAPLLAQCHRIAHLDEVVTEGKQGILDRLAEQTSGANGQP